MTMLDEPTRRSRTFPMSSERRTRSRRRRGEGEGEHSSSRSYRTQHRGGKGIRDIKTTERNGPVIGIVRIRAGDELLMMTARGKTSADPGRTTSASSAATRRACDS